jgi:hypothetical protein
MDEKSALSVQNCWMRSRWRDIEDWGLRLSFFIFSNLSSSFPPFRFWSSVRVCFEVCRVIFGTPTLGGDTGEKRRNYVR